MKKRILAAVLSAALAAFSLFSASAADNDKSSDKEYDYTIMEKTFIPNNFARFFITGNNIDTSTGMNIKDPNNGEVLETAYFDFTSGSKYLYLPNTEGYNFNLHFKKDSGGISGIGTNYRTFSEGGGQYERIRIKLSDYSRGYFNEDGTFTRETPAGKHNFTFTKELNGKYQSALVFLSGNAITGVVPDHDTGMAEFYASTKLGVQTKFMLHCHCNLVVDGKLYDTSLGGTTNGLLYSLTIGDVDKDGWVTLTDAILIQKYTMNPSGFDKLSQRNADVDRNGSINLLDAIKVQKYRLGME